MAKKKQRKRKLPKHLRRKTLKLRKQQALEQETSPIHVVKARLRKAEPVETEGHRHQGASPKVTPIQAALCGWKGDDAGDWQCPADEDTIIAWGQSHYGGNRQDLLAAFNELVSAGLFFRVHKDVFEQPYYFCSFNSNFLTDIPDSPDYVELWDQLAEEYDRKYRAAWRKDGLCWGQGSQSYSSPWGPCLGKACCGFTNGNPSCNHGLFFKHSPQDKDV